MSSTKERESKDFFQAIICACTVVLKTLELDNKVVTPFLQKVFAAENKYEVQSARTDAIKGSVITTTTHCENVSKKRSFAELEKDSLHRAKILAGTNVSRVYSALCPCSEKTTIFLAFLEKAFDANDEHELTDAQAEALKDFDKMAR